MLRKHSASCAAILVTSRKDRCPTAPARGRGRWISWISTIYRSQSKPAAYRAPPRRSVSNPRPVSGRIMRLEDELGVTVFDSVTRAGKSSFMPPTFER